MPTYEYLCENCDHKFEEFQSITADALTDCPSCKEPKLRRLIGTGGAVIFKGSGFYQTDYRSEGYRKAQKADSSDSSSSKSSSDSSSSSSSSGDSSSSSSSSSSTSSSSGSSDS